MTTEAPATIIVSGSSKTDSPDGGDMAFRLFNHFVAQGEPPAEAWDHAGEVLKPRNGIAAIQQDGYNNGDTTKGKPMATAIKAPKKKPNNFSSDTVIRIEEPKGSKWHQRFARGLIRWCVQHHTPLTAICDKHGLSTTSIYAVAGAAKRQTSGKLADDICEAIGIDFSELIELGRKESDA